MSDGRNFLRPVNGPCPAPTGREPCWSDSSPSNGATSRRGGPTDSVCTRAQAPAGQFRRTVPLFDVVLWVVHREADVERLPLDARESGVQRPKEYYMNFGTSQILSILLGNGAGQVGRVTDARPLHGESRSDDSVSRRRCPGADRSERKRGRRRPGNRVDSRSRGFQLRAEPTPPGRSIRKAANRSNSWPITG